MFFLSLFPFFSFGASKGKVVDRNTNIIYVTESNMTAAMTDLPAVFLFVFQGGNNNDQYRAKVEFLATSYGLGTRCFFAVMDGEKNRNFVRKTNQIYTRGYYFYRYGKLVDRYYGQMATAGFFDYVMKKTGMPFTTFDDTPIAMDFIESSVIGVVLFLRRLGGPLLDKFTTLSESLRDNYTFGLCVDEDIAYDLNVEEFPTLVLYRQVDKSHIEYSDSFADATLTDVKAWVHYNAAPQVDVFKINNMAVYAKKKPVVLFFLPVDEKEKSELMKTVIRLSTIFGNDLNFSQIDAVTGNRFMMDIGFGHYADPCVAILNFKDKGKFTKNRYPEEAPFDFDSLSSFIMNYLDGKMAPEVRSEILDPNYNGSVMPICANDFNEKVIDPDIAIMVLYFEPWDHAYEELRGIYIDIADEFQRKSIKRLKVGAFDVSMNDIVNGPKPKTTPCIYLFNRGTKDKPELFEGQFTRQNIVDFLDDETGVRIEL